MFNSFWHITCILVSCYKWHMGQKKKKNWQWNTACFKCLSITGFKLNPDILSEKLRFFLNCEEIPDTLKPKNAVYNWEMPSKTTSLIIEVIHLTLLIYKLLDHVFLLKSTLPKIFAYVTIFSTSFELIKYSDWLRLNTFSTLYRT